MLDGDGQTTWFDAHLTDLGVQQAKQLGRFWFSAVAHDGVPLPRTIYTSPLARCLQTTEYVFSPLADEHQKPFRPIIKENLRERRTLHTCDLRRGRSWIQTNYPGYVLENSVAEEDPFSGQTRPETAREHRARKQRVLEEIFSSDENQVVALTVHSYAIAAILEVCGGDRVRVKEGTCLALLVRGERMEQGPV